VIRFFQDLALNPLLLHGLIAGLLAGVACGVIGPYVVGGRVVFLAGAIAHICIGGLGAALFLRAVVPGFGWVAPLHGALASALLAAVAIAYAHSRVRERLDTLIGAMWAVGMAAGVVLVKYTPGYQSDLLGYLFGSLSTVERNDLLLIGLLDLVILVLAGLFHKRLLAVSLDSEYASLQGVNLFRMRLVLLVLVALTVVTLIQVVGVIMVLALLTLPAATAGHHTSRFGPMVALSTGLGLFLTSVPRAAVYGTRVPPEAAIVIAAAAVYLLSVLVRRRG